MTESTPLPKLIELAEAAKFEKVILANVKKWREIAVRGETDPMNDMLSMLRKAAKEMANLRIQLAKEKLHTAALTSTARNDALDLTAAQARIAELEQQLADAFETHKSLRVVDRKGH